MDDEDFLILFGDDEDEEGEAENPRPPKNRRAGFHLFSRKRSQKKKEPRRKPRLFFFPGLLMF